MLIKIRGQAWPTRSATWWASVHTLSLPLTFTLRGLGASDMLSQPTLTTRRALQVTRDQSPVCRTSRWFKQASTRLDAMGTRLAINLTFVFALGTTNTSICLFTPAHTLGVGRCRWGGPPFRSIRRQSRAHASRLSLTAKSASFLLNSRAKISLPCQFNILCVFHLIILSCPNSPYPCPPPTQYSKKYCPTRPMGRKPSLALRLQSDDWLKFEAASPHKPPGNRSTLPSGTPLARRMS